MLLEGLIVAVGAKAADAVAGESVSRLLDAVLDAREEELRVLGNVDRGVRNLLEGPFRVGISALEDATAGHRSDEQRDDLLVRAREAFREARALEHRDPTRIALIELHLAMTWLALDSWPDGEKHLELAHEALVRATDLLDSPEAPSMAQRLLGRTRAADARVPLVAFLDAVRSLRIQVGAQPTSVPWHPLWGGTTFALGSIEGHPDRYGSGAEADPGDPYWRTYASEVDSVLAWQHLFQYRSQALERVATGEVTPPDSVFSMVDVSFRKAKGQFTSDDQYRDEWQSDIHLVHQVDIEQTMDLIREMFGCRWSAGRVKPELVKETAGDILGARRAGWPESQRLHVANSRFASRRLS